MSYLQHIHTRELIILSALKISIELHHSLTSFRTSAAVTGAAETVMMAVAVAVVAVAVGGGGGSGGGGHFFD